MRLIGTIILAVIFFGLSIREARAGETLTAKLSTSQSKSPKILDTSGYKCLGTEPFWSVTIEGSSLDYDDSEGHQRNVKVIGPLNAENTQEGFATVYTSKGRYDVASVYRTACSDGMSDKVYTHALIYLTGKRVLQGCCTSLVE